MSTRSMIAARRPNGTITSVYCHSDGYYSYNGRRLMEHWHSQPRAVMLTSMGDMSSLGAVIGKKHDFDWRSKLHDRVRHERDRRRSAGEDVDGDVFGDLYQQMRDELPQAREDWCLFYRRDRNDKGAGFGGTFATRDDLIAHFERTMCEYLYLHDAETWWGYTPDPNPDYDDDDVRDPADPRRWTPLAYLLAHDDNTRSKGTVKPGPALYLANRSKRLFDALSEPDEVVEVHVIRDGRRAVVI